MVGRTPRQLSTTLRHHLSPAFAILAGISLPLRAIEPVLRETVRRLTGEAPFNGVSPVDPFCGQEQLRW